MTLHLFTSVEAKKNQNKLKRVFPVMVRSPAQFLLLTLDPTSHIFDPISQIYLKENRAGATMTASVTLKK